jgi:bifunctional non-homologous end joining protein LigD
MPKRRPETQPDKTNDALGRYRRKRRAGATPEPFGRATAAPGTDTPLFVVQQHRARALHFDLRLELDGVLKSWAVPKGPSADPADKRFARLVEDHPLDYADFEGRIPDGNYGAGWVIVWDRGTYRPLEDLRRGFERGKLLFELQGGKLRGRWTLVRTRSDADWLLIKEHDDAARSPGDDFPADSVLSGLTLQQLPEAARIARRFAARVARLQGTRNRREPFEPAPMLASPGEAFDHRDWVFELKYDGYRMLAHRTGDDVALLSRNGRTLNPPFPEIVHAMACLPYPDLVIDGEIVVHDTSGRPSFAALQQRAAVSGALEVAAAARHQPATLYAFDLLAAAGRDLRGLPLTRRKRLLQEVLPSTGVLRYSEHVARQGLATYDTARRLGLEGIVAKRASAPYSGGRSKDWIKVRARLSDDFVIAGWSPSKSNRHDIGALALAEYRGGTLTYTGKVGSGLKGEARASLARELAALPPAPALGDAGDVHWVAPRLVCEVAFREYTTHGHLRQPVFLRLRPDKAPRECVGRFDDPQPPTALPAAREVTVTNRDKTFFPEAGLTKGDLVDYYEAIAPWMLPYLEDRPLVLTRFPDGIHGKQFYQRDAPDFVPAWIEREVLWSESAEREVRYFVANDVASLLYLANMGTIPIHAWHSRTRDLEHPDWCVLDLDPKGAPFQAVVEVTLAIRDLCAEIDLPAFPKTSGASGLHVLLPLGGRLTHEQARTLGELLATVIVRRLPELATVTRAVRRREGKVYVDYLQNGHGRLLVAPFSARAEPAASVSMPLGWHEVHRGLSNERFTLRNAVRRMRRLRRDPLREVLTTRPDLERVLQALLALTDDGRRPTDA